MRAERLLPEDPKPGRDRRSPFARDRARVLHSAALRRLAGKTQVVGPGEDAEITGVPRTRLTHSLEVAQIGRDIAEELGLDPDVVDAAGLAHDIGHPPFGHNGERALDTVAGPCGGFEGNAQTLRLLTRLEPKTFDDERCRGLNLTRATLDACTKYPWERTPGTRKFGVYADDADVFAWVRAGAPAGHRCVEAQVMDWADDVAYSVHDVEDGVLAGRIRLGRLAEAGERAELVDVAVEAYAGAMNRGSTPTGAPLSLGATTSTASTAGPTVADLERACESLAVLAPGADYDGSLSASVALKRLTSELVGRFVSTAVEATRAAHGDIVAPGHAADLVVPVAVRAEVALLKAAALRWVMRDPARRAAQARERALIAELAERLHTDAPGVLDPSLAGAWEAAPDDAGRLRVVVDQVATLTDAQARAWCERLRAGEGSGPRVTAGGHG